MSLIVLLICCAYLFLRFVLCVLKSLFAVVFADVIK